MCTVACSFYERMQCCQDPDVPWIAQQAVNDWINQTLSHLSLLRSAVTNCSFHFILSFYSGNYVVKERCMLDICLRLRDKCNSRIKVNNERELVVLVAWALNTRSNITLGLGIHELLWQKVKSVFGLP